MVGDIIFNSFSPEMFSGLDMPIIVVYHNITKDYHGYFVARVWDGMKNEKTSKILVEKELDTLISKVPDRFVKMMRHPENPPEIITTFI